MCVIEKWDKVSQDGHREPQETYYFCIARHEPGHSGTIQIKTLQDEHVETLPNAFRSNSNRDARMAGFPVFNSRVQPEVSAEQNTEKGSDKWKTPVVTKNGGFKLNFRFHIPFTSGTKPKPGITPREHHNRRRALRAASPSPPNHSPPRLPRFEQDTERVEKASRRARHETQREEFERRERRERRHIEDRRHECLIEEVDRERSRIEEVERHERLLIEDGHREHRRIENGRRERRLIEIEQERKTLYNPQDLDNDLQHRSRVVRENRAKIERDQSRPLTVHYQSLREWREGSATVDRNDFDAERGSAAIDETLRNRRKEPEQEEIKTAFNQNHSGESIREGHNLLNRQEQPGIHGLPDSVGYPSKEGSNSILKSNEAGVERTILVPFQDTKINVGGQAESSPLSVNYQDSPASHDKHTSNDAFGFKGSLDDREEIKFANTNPISRSSMKRDRSSWELESLRMQWNSTHRADRLSSLSDLERAPSSTSIGELSDSLADDLDSLNPNDRPGLAYTGSTVSSIELIEKSGMLANRFAQTILRDDDLKSLCHSAVQRMSYDKFERNMRRLLDEYVTDLLQEARQHTERSAARAIKRHQDEVVGALGVTLDPDKAAKAAKLSQLSKQPASKIKTMQSYLSDTFNVPVSWDTEVKSEKDDNSSESSGNENALILRFESVKPFLCDGAAFNNLKENFRNFLSPQSRDSRLAALKGAGTGAINEAMMLKTGPEIDIKAAQETTILQECNQTDADVQAEADQNPDFEDYDMEPSVGDRFKVFVERILGRPLLWWPFKEPLRPLALGMRRLLWKCDCGSNIYFSVPSQPEAVDTSLPSSTRPFLQTGNTQSLPLHNQPSFNLRHTNTQASQPGVTTAQPTPSNDPNSPPIFSGSQVGSSTQYPSPYNANGQFIYWCINAGDRYAQAIELDALQLTDDGLATRLLHEYATLKGWWHQFWTMTSCHSASFKQFLYMYDDENTVNCSNDPKLPDDDAEYEYDKWIPLERYRSWLEAIIEHQFQKHVAFKTPWSADRVVSASSRLGCQKLLRHIPKKTPQRLEAKRLNEGYGMQANARIAVSRAVAMFLVWHGGSTIFLICWLARHPGDLQNAFVFLTTTLAGFMAYVAILLMFQQ